MSAVWNGKLCDSRSDVVLDSILLIAILAAYGPQLSTNDCGQTYADDLSPWYLVFQVCFSNTQLSHGLLLSRYAWPTSEAPILKQIWERELDGIEALGGILGLLQIAIHWICSMTLLMRHMVMAMPITHRVFYASFLEEPALPALLHCGLILYPAVTLSLPRSPRREMGTEIIAALVSMANQVSSPIFAVLQFCAMFADFDSKCRQPNDQLAIVLLAQGTVTALVAVRWTLRLGRPEYDTTWPSSWSVYYEWGLVYLWSFPVVSYALQAVVLFAGYHLIHVWSADPLKQVQACR